MKFTGVKKKNPKSNSVATLPRNQDKKRGSILDAGGGQIIHSRIDTLVEFFSFMVKMKDWESLSLKWESSFSLFFCTSQNP